MAILNDFDADLREIESDIPAVLTWAGKPYPCTHGNLESRSEVEGLIGVRENIDQIAVLRTQLFSATRPALSETVVLNGVTYRIMRTETDAVNAALTLYLQEEDA